MLVGAWFALFGLTFLRKLLAPDQTLVDREEVPQEKVAVLSCDEGVSLWPLETEGNGLHFDWLRVLLYELQELVDDVAVGPAVVAGLVKGSRLG